MINQLKFRTDRPLGATFVELNPYRCMLARALRSGVRNLSLDSLLRTPLRRARWKYKRGDIFPTEVAPQGRELA